MLPNFLIIGAAKSATTWLMHNLGRHPHVYVHDTEIHYFSQDHIKRLPWYEDHFTKVKNERAVGENSNSYLPDPESPRRIHELLPAARLIAVLRQPVERAYSAYCMRFAQGTASADVGAYLDPDRDPIGRYPDVLTPGLYARHLRRYYRLFPESQLKVMLYDDLKADSQTFVGEILSFLDVDSSLMPAAEKEAVNVRRTRIYPARFGAMIAAVEKLRPGRNLLKKIVAYPPAKRLRERLKTQRVHYPQLPAELQEKLAHFYASEIDDLEALMGRNLSAWRHG